MDAADFKPADVDVPLFILEDSRMKAGEAKTYHVFESRYKLMIKECMDQGRPLLVVGPDHDAIGSLCTVGDTTHDPVSGGCVAVLHCERLAVASERTTCRAEFGLVRARGLRPPEFNTPPLPLTRPRPT